MSQSASAKTDQITPSPFLRALEWADRMVLRGWRVFVSLKFGIFLLVLIGICSIYGTIRYGSNAALGDNAIPMARALFFESRWFVTLLLLFAINLAVSTWHVTKMSFTIFWKKEFRRGRAYYEHGSSPRAEIEVPGGLDEAEKVLRGRYTRVHRDGNALFAHRGILSRIGPTIVHAGILMVIFSQVAKAMLIWSGAAVTEGRFVAEEGGPAINFISEPIDLAQQMTELNRRDRVIPYWLRVLDFDEIKHPNSNMPAYYSTLLEVRDPATQTVTVAQLDMNHSLRIGNLTFHQAGFVELEEGPLPRINFDVRDTVTGERLAVADASPGVRARVGDTEYFIEVDGIHAGDMWRLYSMDSPKVAVAEGRLSQGNRIHFTYRLEEFFPHLRINPETGRPENASAHPLNPALRLTALLEDSPIGTGWLFTDPELAEAAPDVHPRFRLRFDDIRVRRGQEVEGIDWTEPGSAIFVVSVEDRETGSVVREDVLRIGEMSRPLIDTVASDEFAEALGTENGFAVRVMGPATRYATILSVVNEPTVIWTKWGVVLLVLGASITFMFRYRAVYAWWDEKRETLRLALVPRWGQSPVQEEFDELVKVLTHGKGPVKRVREPEMQLDEVPPAHQTVGAGSAG